MKRSHWAMKRLAKLTLLLTFVVLLAKKVVAVKMLKVGMVKAHVFFFTVEKSLEEYEDKSANHEFKN